MLADEDSLRVFIFRLLKREVKNSHEQEFFLKGVPFAEAFIKIQISALHLSSITRSKLALRHMDFLLDLSFRKLANSVEKLGFFLALASFSLLDQYDIGLKAHPFSFIHLQNIAAVQAEAWVDIGHLSPLIRTCPRVKLARS